MGFILNQIPFYQVWTIVVILHAVCWLLFPVLVTRFFQLPIDRIAIMGGGSKTRILMGCRVSLGWIPTGVTISFSDEVLKRMRPVHHILLGVSGLLSEFFIVLVFLDLDTLVKMIVASPDIVWSFLHSPMTAGADYLDRFFMVCEKSRMTGVGLLSAFGLVLSLLPFPAGTTVSTAIMALLPDKLLSIYGLTSVAFVIYAFCAVALSYYSVIF